jgi:hypothetical protein
VHDTKKGLTVPNEHEMYQMVIKYPRCLSNIPNGHEIHQQFASKGPPKCSQIEIFGSENKPSGNPALQTQFCI